MAGERGASVLCGCDRGRRGALNFAPIDLQRRIVDEAIENRDIPALMFLGVLYLAVILIQGVLKYALMLYQGWVGESAVKTARDQLAAIVSERPARNDTNSGQTVNVIGREIDNVGGFVGTSISEFVVNSTLLIVIAGYMLYIQPVIALVSAVFLLPQIFLALYMQTDLNKLVERQVGLYAVSATRRTPAPRASPRNPARQGAQSARSSATAFSSIISNSD